MTDKVNALLKKRGGYMTSKQAEENGVSNQVLQRMMEYGIIERAAHGLYISADIFPDRFFVAQYRCPKGVFSNETALFLHGFSDRNPLRLTMTIPSGWNSRSLTDPDYEFFYSNPKKMGLGVCQAETPSKMKVMVYDVERTLCDCLRNLGKLDRDLVLTALKRYVKDKNRDSAKLLEYASALKIRDIVYRYLEVLV